MGMEILAKKEDESSRQYVRRCLLYNIVNVEIKPGERIIEKEYCDLFQVSRTPIREAILDLHKNHLIDVMPKRGTFVSYIAKTGWKKCASCGPSWKRKSPGKPAGN